MPTSRKVRPALTPIGPQLDAIAGLNFSDCVKYFAAKQSDREKAIGQMVETIEGDLETDDIAIVSEGNDNGAYVMAWKWVDFSGTPYNKEDGEDA